MKIKLYSQFCNEHIAAVSNPQMEITNDDLNHFCGFNDRTLQGPKRDFIQSHIDSSNIKIGSEYDWKDNSVEKEHALWSTDYKYCYNARAGYDSFILVYSNIELPKCTPFDSFIEFTSVNEDHATNDIVDGCVQTLMDDYNLFFEPRNIHGFNYKIEGEFPYSDQFMLELKKAINRLESEDYKVRVFFELILNGSQYHIESTGIDTYDYMKSQVEYAIEKCISQVPHKRTRENLHTNIYHFGFRVMTRGDWVRF
jgi:hypothetical protein